MRFIIIHPSRKRPQQSAQTYLKWSNATKYPDGTRWILSVDNDDDIAAYIDAYFQIRTCVTPVINNNTSSVEAINNAAKHFMADDGDVFLVVSDDTEPCHHWDEKIYDLVKDKTDWILKTQDGIQNWIITMPIMDRAYYNRFGYIYYPGYQHLFCDTELTCVADITGRKITSNLLFPHNHYSIGKGIKDAVYEKNDLTNEQGEKLFLERYSRNFDLPKGNPITDGGMINWLKKRHVNA
jgi:hypothetical protein